MDIEKELREAYLSGVIEAQAAAKITGMRFNFEGMANGYTQTKVKELIIHGVVVNEVVVCCPSCDHENRELANYCDDCGTCLTD
ncbi:MAG: hypothetical protein GY679_04040 [Mycoplasma sp.]|nr:hypothetical protein [Mycoplasma sp.]